MSALLLLLISCGGHASPTETAQDTGVPFAPTFGSWEAHFGATWGGDCALDDTNTYLPADQGWKIATYRYGFSVLDEVGYWHGCSLDGTAFECDLPVTTNDYSSIGYDIYATYTPVWAGDFTDANDLSGAYTLHAECVGSDCDLPSSFGQNFTFPCTATTPLTASFLDPL